MKAAVIYYSKAGNTRKIAEKVAFAFGADLYFVEPGKGGGRTVAAYKIKQKQESMT